MTSGTELNIDCQSLIFGRSKKKLSNLENACKFLEKILVVIDMNRKARQAKLKPGGPG